MRDEAAGLAIEDGSAAEPGHAIECLKPGELIFQRGIIAAGQPVCGAAGWLAQDLAAGAGLFVDDGDRDRVVGECERRGLPGRAAADDRDIEGVRLRQGW